jgi:hypothetical protein
MTKIIAAQRNEFPGFGVILISPTTSRSNYNPSRFKNKVTEVFCTATVFWGGRRESKTP